MAATVLLRAGARNLRVGKFRQEMPLEEFTATAAERVLTCMGLGDWTVTVHLVENDEITQLNHEHRGKKAATDVLSFPTIDNVNPDAFWHYRPPHGTDLDLGDIVVSVPFVQAWCLREDIDFADRLTELYIHGMCHLIGHDHVEDNDFERMQDVEDEVLLCVRSFDA